MMPSSLKGKNRRTRTRKPMPIGAGLAARLAQLAEGRGAAEPLLTMPDGARWSASLHHKRFRQAVQAAGLPSDTTAYSMRHSAITKALLANVPVRLVASSFDTSIGQIEKAYSRFISDHGDEMMRRAAFDNDADGDSVVVPIARKKRSGIPLK
jgi:hypothetical protein